MQLGATAVLPTTLADSPEWDVPQTCEFSIIMSSRLFPNAEAWSSFLTDSRKTVVQSVLQLDKALTSDNTEFWGWKKIDANTQRASFRAPANQKTALLAASGVRVPFIIQDLCRNQADMDDRDKSCAVVWLGRRTYGESLVLLKQVVGNLGLLSIPKVSESGLNPLIFRLSAHWWFLPSFPPRTCLCGEACVTQSLVFLLDARVLKWLSVLPSGTGP